MRTSTCRICGVTFNKKTRKYRGARSNACDAHNRYFTLPKGLFEEIAGHYDASVRPSEAAEMVG